jgi:pyruvate ferredoxin oxidoreductase delta subunit
MSKPKCWQDVPLGTIAWGASALDVETGLWRSMRPVLDTNKCISCLKCWLQCPDSSIQTDAEGRVSAINMFFCKGCGVCAQVCPVNAISMHQEADFSNEKREHGEDPGRVADHVK